MDLQFRPCHCVCDLGLRALHAVIHVGSGTLYGWFCAAFKSVHMYHWQLSMLHYGIMNTPHHAAGL